MAFLNSLRILLHNSVYFLPIPASWETETIHNFRVKIQFPRITVLFRASFDSLTPPD